MKKTLNIILLAATVLLIFFLLKTFVIGFYQVKSGSMSPTLRKGDGVIVNKMVYLVGNNPDLGDVIIFGQNGRNLVKRVAGMQGDTVLFDDNNIFVNGKAVRHNEYKKIDEDMLLEEIILRDQELFVIGDNFSRSIDSREFGTVNTSQIIGRAIVIYYSKKNGETGSRRIGNIIK